MLASLSRDLLLTAVRKQTDGRERLLVAFVIPPLWVPAAPLGRNLLVAVPQSARFERGQEFPGAGLDLFLLK